MNENTYGILPETDKGKRILLFWVLFVLTLGLLGGCLHSVADVFYQEAWNDIDDSWRLLWMSFSIFLGLTVRAYRYRNDNGTPYLVYLKYVGYLFLPNFFLFALCHSNLNMKNWVYYPIALIGGVMFAQPDGLPEKTQGTLAKLLGIN